MKKHYLNYLLLITLALLLILFTKNSNFLFGSTTDWLNQHVTIAEYFRNLFYETSSLFPNFSLHLGGGMNIFNISYYGLYSPWLLLSYLLPQVEMVTFIQVINILSYLGTIILMYRFLIHKKYSNEVSLVGAIIMTFASPVLFHFHRQFMFTNYLPFLIIGLFGIDAFFDKGKKNLLVISTFLIIMTSYYYSISSLLVLVIYGLYCFLKKEKTFTKDEIKKIWIPFFLTLGLGILISSILIIPSFLTLIQGGRDVLNSTSFVTYFIPQLSFWNLLYHNYNMGLSITALISLIVGIFSKKKAIKIVSIIVVIILLFPIFSLLLNGGLYPRGKVFIAFLPLIILLIAEFLETVALENKQIPWLKVLIILGICLSFVYLFNIRNQDYSWVFFIDVILSFVAIYFAKYKNKTKLFLVIPVIVMFPLAIIVNRQEEYVRLSDYDSKVEEEITTLLEEVTNEDNSFYRFNNFNDVTNTMNKIYNQDYYQTSLYSSSENNLYRSFYFDIMKNAQSEINYLMLANSMNPIFLKYMNVKYVVGKKAPLGYELIKEGSTVNLYINDKTFPLGYATSRLSSKAMFQLLDYPNNIAYLMQSAIVDNPKGTSLSWNLREYDLGLNSLEGLHKINDEKETISVPLKQKLENQVLLLSFEVTPDDYCKDEDTKTITIEGISNSQSCDNWTYGNGNHTFYYQVSSSEVLDKIDVTFQEGLYEIANVKSYIFDLTEMENYLNSIDPFLIDKEQTKGDVIKGHIEVSEDGYFITSLPYDKGYRVLVDGVKQDIEVVNTAFVGFPVTKGSHDVVITYKAPGHTTGMVFSTIGIVILIGMNIYHLVKKND